MDGPRCHQQSRNLEGNYCWSKAHPLTWSVQKVSRITYIRFLVFLWHYVDTHIPSLMPTSSVILNVQLIFDSYFVWTCFGSSSIFAYSKKWIKKSVSKFHGGTVDKEYYLQVICNLRETIRQKKN